MTTSPTITEPNAVAVAPLRLTARGRRVVAVLALLVGMLGSGALLAQPAIAAASSASATVEYETVTVGAGETLWDVATSVTEDRDVRDVVADVQQLNGLDGSHVEPGQVLSVPNER